TGEKIWFELIVEPYSQGILVRSVNIMKKKFLEEQLRQAQKMEAVGQLAGGVAHDFNNKLSIMMSYTDLALNQVRGRDQLLEGYLLKIQKAIHQSTAMTKRILAFSRQQTLDVQTLNLNTLLAESLENFTQIIGHDIRLEYRLAHDLKKVSIDPAQMEEVVLNLLINARDAMPE